MNPEQQELHRAVTNRYQNDPMFHSVVKTAVGHVKEGLREADGRDMTHEEEALTSMAAAAALVISERSVTPPPDRPSNKEVFKRMLDRQIVAFDPQTYLHIKREIEKDRRLLQYRCQSRWAGNQCHLVASHEGPHEGTTLDDSDTSWTDRDAMKFALHPPKIAPVCQIPDCGCTGEAHP